MSHDATELRPALEESALVALASAVRRTVDGPYIPRRHRPSSLDAASCRSRAPHTVCSATATSTGPDGLLRPQSSSSSSPHRGQAQTPLEAARGPHSLVLSDVTSLVFLVLCAPRFSPVELWSTTGGRATISSSHRPPTSSRSGCHASPSVAATLPARPYAPCSLGCEAEEARKERECTHGGVCCTGTRAIGSCHI